MITYLCIKFQSNTLFFSKDITQKPFVLRMGRTGREGRDEWKDVRTDNGDTLPSPLKMAGHKKCLTALWTGFFKMVNQTVNL